MSASYALPDDFGRWGIARAARRGHEHDHEPRRGARGPRGPRGAEWDEIAGSDFGGPRGRGGRRGRSRRGDIRVAVLALLAERPMHGYEIITELAERSGGAWRPSPGSVYPTLQQLADEGLVRAVEEDGRRVMHLTDDGAKAAEAAAAGRSQLPWDEASEGFGNDRKRLVRTFKSLAMAMAQVAEAGSPQQAAQAEQILADARRRLYGLLAEPDAAPADADPTVVDTSRTQTPEPPPT